MANVTDPLVAQLSGSDPQNLMEYITRQKIYDSRYWKEECFGLTVVNVLEKCTKLQCIGTVPHTSCLALVLKLLQLHPDHELVVTAFVEPRPTYLKYARAVGALYIRLTSRPAQVYHALEPLYTDHRKIRVVQAGTWTVTTMDQWVHALLTTNSCLGIALPRLASRQTLQEGGYLPMGPRESHVLEPYTVANDNNDATTNPLERYLHFKATVEHCPAAMAAYTLRRERLDRSNDGLAPNATARTNAEPSHGSKHKSYKGLFKSSAASSTTVTTTATHVSAATDTTSDAYWNEQRSKLGLNPLK